MPAPAFVHVYFCVHVYEDACVAFSSLLPFIFLFLPGRSTQTREDWLMQLMLKVSLWGKYLCPHSTPLKMVRLHMGAQGFPHATACRIRGKCKMLSKAGTWLKSKKYRSKNSRSSLHWQNGEHIFSLSFSHEHSVWENPFYLFAWSPVGYSWRAVCWFWLE